MALGQNPPAKLSSWPTPETQWERIHVDYADYWVTYRLVVVDALSKWPIVVAMNTTTSTATITALHSMFRTWGLPNVLVSDNGPQFKSF